MKKIFSFDAGRIKSAAGFAQRHQPNPAVRFIRAPLTTNHDVHCFIAQLRIHAHKLEWFAKN
jgi:hypothetical protein